MKSTRCQLLAFVLASALRGPVAAQVVYTLQHSIAAPPGVQSGAQLGHGVAVDGGFTVAGAPYDDTGESNSGVVKVFDSTTGALRYVLANPGPAASDNFGYAVAISGTRVVVGAFSNDTGAPDAGSAYVYDLSSGTPTIPVATLNNPGPAEFDYFGLVVAISGTRVVVGAYRDDTGGTDAGSAYVYDLSSATPTVPVRTLNNPGPAAFDVFGRSVAISGTRVVVGAPSDDTGATNAGSTYVYDLSSATPTVPVRTLNNPGPAADDNFGMSVAVFGTRVVVGAWRDDTGANGAGSAFVYDLSSATPTVPVRTLNNPDPAVNDNFGYSVAISGTRVVVGAHNDDTEASNAGSAYVYDLGSGSPTVPMAFPGLAAGDVFGSSVTLSGTLMVAGAPHDDTAAEDAGSAYVYDLSSGTPTVPVVALHNPGPAAFDFFGISVAISGTRVVVGAQQDDTGATDAGSAYVYDLSSGTPPVLVATFHNPGPVTSDYFGNSVAISGTRVVVGASADGSSMGDAGSAYVYDLNSETPAMPVAVFDNPGLPGSHLFGISVAISGTRVVVGASYDDTGAPGAGRAYVYDLSSATPTVPVVTLDNPNPGQSDHFGNSVAISDSRVVVGSPRDDTGAPEAGIAYVYDLSRATPAVPVAELRNPGPAEADEFGYAVAISGTRVVVGVPRDDPGAVESAGSAYVYDLNSATPTVPVATLHNPGPGENDFFGISVAISGTRVVVCARLDDTGATDAGSAYVYDLSSGTPTVPVATINNPGPAIGDNFALSAAIDGAALAIGTPFANTPQADKGTACIFTSDADGDGLLDGWEIAHFGTTAGHSALDDSDGDGHNELLELAFGLNPALTNPGGLPPVANEGGYLTMTITRRPGATCEVQSAGTLLPDPFSPATTTVLIDNTTTLKVRDNMLIGTAPSRFMRTKVTAAP